MLRLWRELMKPISLQFSGIHSFKKEANINFAMLSAGHIFGIFGKTGSGKTTILDAMTLALYGKITRSKNKADFINTQTKKAQVRFTFSIQYAGKTQVYEVERTFTIKEDASVKQEAQVCLVVGKNKQMLAEGMSKVDAKIQDIIGFGIAEFHKCIALPQNEFSDFLKSEPNKRVEMIGNIFDLQKYGTKLWEKAKEKEQQCKTELVGIESKLEMLPVDIDAETLVLEKQKNEQNNILKNLRIQFEKQQKEVQQLQAQAAQTERYAQVTKALQKLGEDTPALGNMEKEVQEYMRAVEVKPLLKEWETVVYALNEAQGEYEEQCKTKEILEQKKEVLRTSGQQNKEKVVAEKQMLDVQMEKLRALLQEEPSIQEKEREKCALGQSAEQLNKEIRRLTEEKEALNAGINASACKQKTLTEQQVVVQKKLQQREHVLGLKQLQEEHAFLETLERKLSEEIDVLATQTDNVCKENKKITQNLQKEVKQQEILLEKLGLSKHATMDIVYEECIRLQKNLQAIKDLQQLLRVFEKEKDIQQQLKMQKVEELNQLKQKLSALTTQKQALEQKKEELRKEQQKTVKDRDAAMEYHCENLVKSKLSIGDVCPICEQTVMRRPLFEKVDIASFDKAIKYFENELYVWEKEYADTIEKITSVEVQMQSAYTAIKNCDAKIDMYTRSTQETGLAFGVQVEPSTAQKQCEEQIKTIQNALRVYQTIAEQIQNYKNCLLELAGQNVSQKSSVQQLQKLFDYITSVKAEKQFGIQSLEKNASTNVQDNYETIEKQYNEITAQLDEIIREKMRAMEKITRIATELSALQQEYMAQTTKSAMLEEKITEWNTQKQQVAPGDVSVLEQLKLHAKRKEKLEHFEEGAREKEIELENQITGITKSMEILRIEVESKQRRADKLKQTLDASIQQKGFRCVEQVQTYLQDEAKMELKKIKFQEKKASIRALKAEMAQLLEVLGQDFSLETMREKELAYQALQQQITQTHATLATIQMQLQQLNEKQEQKQTLLQSYAQAKQQWDTAKELLDCLRGKALMQFVAEEIMEKITSLANQKLQVLFDGQYQLIVKEKEFFVVDNFDNGAVRSASTLSGGEMFVVSLSLALAISETIAYASDRSIDFFFLDEGFGSLDKDLREVVMQSLKRLADKNFTIGFISHVPELQEQMQTKLLVSKPSEAMGSVVCLEQGL